MQLIYSQRSDGTWAEEVRTAAEQLRDNKPARVKRKLEGSEKQSIDTRIGLIYNIRGSKGDNTASLTWLNKAIGLALRGYAVSTDLSYFWEETLTTTLPG